MLTRKDNELIRRLLKRELIILRDKEQSECTKKRAQGWGVCRALKHLEAVQLPAHLIEEEKKCALPFNKRLYIAMKRRGYDVAALSSESGVLSSTIVRILSGDNFPSHTTPSSLAWGLGADIIYKSTGGRFL